MKPKLLHILEKCNTIKQLKQTHLQIITNGFQEHNFLVPKLIHLSFDLISLDYAISVFQNSPNPNYIAYNTMIKCFIGNSHKIKEAVRIYKRMVEASVSPNTFTFCFLLRCFESVEALGCGRLVHGQIVKMGFDSSVFVGNTLLNFYAKCWGLEMGRKVFDEMPDRDVVSWNIMIGVYMDFGEIGCAMRLFDVMPERSVVSWNTFISGASRGGEMELAVRVFKEMPARNEVSWNAMVSGYVKAGDLMAAEALFDEMPVKSVVSCTAMITGYIVAGNVELARMIFEQMSCRNEVSWNAMIAGYVHNNMFEEALSVFQQMLIEGKCKPNGATLVSALSACTHLGSLENGKWIDSYIKRNKVELSNQLGNALIDMFAKCGDLENARVIFNKMAEKCIITWTTMVTGLAVNGECRQAVEIFDIMCLEGLKPDDVLFIAVLTACAHGGLVDMGKRVFDQMINEYDIEPQMEHYGCMVDLLGRSGKFDEAVQFMEGMHLEPNAIIWTSLLNACKLHGKSELLKSISRKILKKEPSNPGYLTLITNSSSSVGQWQDALDIRMGMRSQGIEKVPGCSLIQIGNTVHEFLSKDKKHGHMKEIYQVLNSINGHVRATCNLS